MEFNKENEYKDLVKEKVKELYDICLKNKIPFFLSVCVKDNGKKTEYINEFLSPTYLKMSLYEDHFPEFYKVNVGMKADVKRTSFLFEDDVETGEIND